MSLEKFINSPWDTSHRVYKDSALAMTPAPEYASSEVILSSMSRVLGFASIKDGMVPQNGRDLEKKIHKARDSGWKPDKSAVDADTIDLILHSVLESPKLPNQSLKRFLQVTPIIPEFSSFSGSARLASNSWSPGALIRRMICLGAATRQNRDDIWSSLFDAISISDDDDIFARFMQQEILQWETMPEWRLSMNDEDVRMCDDDLKVVNFPARQFVIDLVAIISAKNLVTRRQWTSLLESLIRLASVSHVIWLCDVHTNMWTDCIKKALTEDFPEDTETVRNLMYNHDFTYLTYGNRAIPRLKDYTSAYLTARLGINLVLWGLEEIGSPVSKGLSSAKEVAEFCKIISKNKDKLAKLNILRSMSEISEREIKFLLCRKGIGQNVMEFARHVLGQRNTANPILRGYDQGYILHQKTKKGQWIVSLGPVTVLALVHCSLSGMAGPRSVHRLSQHLRSYGLLVDHREIAQNDLGHQLRMLGLVLDSPDAESGMLLITPFANTSYPQEAKR